MKIKFNILTLFLVFLISCTSESNDNAEITIENIIPNTGYCGDIIIINGNNFGTDATAVLVKFDEEFSEIVSINNSQIQVTIPNNIQSSTIFISVNNNPYVNAGIYNKPIDTKEYYLIGNRELIGIRNNSKIKIDYSDNLFSSNDHIINTSITNFSNESIFFNTLKNDDSIILNKVSVDSENIENVYINFNSVFPNPSNFPIAEVMFYDNLSQTLYAIANEWTSSDKLLIIIDPNTGLASDTGIAFNITGIISSTVFDKDNKLLYFTKRDDKKIYKLNIMSGLIESNEISSVTIPNLTAIHSLIMDNDNNLYAIAGENHGGYLSIINYSSGIATQLIQNPILTKDFNKPIYDQINNEIIYCHFTFTQDYSSPNAADIQNNHFLIYNINENSSIEFETCSSFGIVGLFGNKNVNE